MLRLTIAAVAALLAAGSAFGQGAPTAPAKPVTAAPPAAGANPSHAGAAKPTASTPESRSAAALALSHESTFDEGTAQRIREAALSYSDIAVRGGWPAIPADAKFAIGVAGRTTVSCAGASSSPATLPRTRPAARSTMGWPKR